MLCICAVLFEDLVASVGPPLGEVAVYEADRDLLVEQRAHAEEGARIEAFGRRRAPLLPCTCGCPP